MANGIFDTADETRQENAERALRDAIEHIRRMSEPEPYRSLRLQKERIEAERDRAAEQALYDLQADTLRREIRGLGETPCA